QQRIEQLRKALETKARVEFEEHTVDQQGRVSYYTRRLNPALNQEGEVELIIAHGMNITALRRAQDETAISEAKNSAILAAIPDLMFILDQEGRYLSMENEEQMHPHMPQEQVAGSSIYHLLPGAVAARYRKVIAKVLATGRHEKVTYDLELAGDLRYYEGRILKYSHDKVLLVVRDITEEKKAALEIDEKNEF
ncbi:PAS domain S-box protein, partial [Bacillus tequilensis]|nr:PAS domain S-box protein [Bacillus tequilensis]